MIFQNKIIVPNIPKKQYTLPTDVLPNDSKDLSLRIYFGAMTYQQLNLCSGEAEPNELNEPNERNVRNECNDPNNHNELNESNELNETNKPNELNEPNEPNGPDEPNKPNESNELLEPMYQSA